MANLSNFSSILMVVVGLGFVIFWHELGHFLLAKWNDVKVEVFSIGFGPSLWQVRRGETIYRLSAIPLGGYVKMLGEEPAEATQAPDRSSDPRAFHNKSVGGRMAIISAGVVMNLILGVVCFILAYGWGGMAVTPAQIGTVLPGRPAFEAGLRPGDEVVAINGRGEVTFNKLSMKAALSGSGEALHLEVRRPGVSNLLNFAIVPERTGSEDRPTIGISPAQSLTLFSTTPFVRLPGLEGQAKSDPAQAAKKAQGSGQDAEFPFEGGDRIVAAGLAGEPTKPIADGFEFQRLLVQDRDRPLTVVVERGGPESEAADSETPKTLSVTLPPNHFLTLGILPETGPIGSVQADSIAQKAGFREGDRIVKVDGQDLNPLRLPEYLFDHAGQPVEFTINRSTRDGSQETLTLTATPDATPPWVQPMSLADSPLNLPGLGLAIQVESRIAAVSEGSPAARAGLVPGQMITAVTIKARDDKGNLKENTYDLTGDREGQGNNERIGWASAFGLLQGLPIEEVGLTVAGHPNSIILRPEADPTWFNPARGLELAYVHATLPPQGVMASVRRGLDDTQENIYGIYGMLRGLIQRRVGKNNIAGPIRIATIAYRVAGVGWVPFIHFLGMLSINLAVINFLPIPPLDGGQLMFLIAEKFRGRPLPESALATGTYVGLLLVLGLMVFVVYQDVVLSFFGG